MRRRVLLIALFLLLGAAINVAVAWGCARSSPLCPFEWAPISDQDATWLRSHGWDCDLSRVAVGPGVNCCFYSGIPDSADGLRFVGASTVVASQLDSGLPLRVMTMRWVKSRRTPNQERTPLDVEQEFRVAALDFVAPRQMHLMPMKPIITPFALNTLLYAVITWLLIRGPFALRRLLRAKRGQCAACGYDLRGQTSIDATAARCPECGAIAARART